MSEERKKVFCKVCREEIYDGAIKCTHCNSFQNWSRHLAISNTYLALLIALFSTMSVFISAITSITTPRNHSMYATFNSLGGGVEGEKEKRLAFYIWNEGKEPGGVHKVSLTYSLKNHQPVKVRLYSDISSKLDLFKYEEHGEVFLKVLDVHKLNFEVLKLISETDLSCFVEIYSLGIKGKIRKVASDAINGDICLDYLKSYE